MMTWVYLLMFGPLLAGVVLAFVWWLMWGRKAGLLIGAASVFTLAAGLLALLVEASVRLMTTWALLPSDLQRALWDWYDEYQFTIPLVLGILGVVLLVFPIRSRGGQGAAELTRRTPVSFTRGRWFVTPSVLLVLIVLITVLAGVASQPDPTTGRYTMYFVELVGERGIGATIYGWYYSVPALILTGVLILITIAGMSLIARPALAEDQERDTLTRTTRTRNIVAAGTGALLLHLGPVFLSLSSTASIRGTFPTPEATATFWPTFAALQPVFAGTSLLCTALGVAFWATVVLSAIPSRRRVPATARS